MSTPTLTPREHEVLRLLAAGYSVAQIALELYISYDTAKTHTKRLYRSIGAVNAAHAVALGFSAGLLP